MTDERERVRKDILAHYHQEHEALGEEGTLRLLEMGRTWDVSSILSGGGVVVFPHALVGDCGQHVAAAIHGCLDSGADRVLVISVMHAITQELQDARVRVAEGGAPSREASWGIWGPGVEGVDSWRRDHVLTSFRHLWKAETKRRGVRGAEVIERYPYLAGGKPEALPGIEALADLAKDAVIVSTADPFHHGIAYGDAPEASYAPDEEGLAHARGRIEEGIAILEQGDYWGYNRHCVEAKSDARDAGQVFRFLRGPMKGRILDLAYSDASDIYRQPKPSWVAAPLIEWRVQAPAHSE